ncbi:hypothetical protein AG0111_0g8282 [Alternaria gaisen]|uniref:Uncharacterized protein n=1 Tax=Alternaria gaisen TaxID=167740 RepID=A0ACB6FGA1_9PLEO|nr:hypothetical protein AG0111_0g8282 [Alternaria gaisen]
MTTNTHATAKPAKPTPLDWKKSRNVRRRIKQKADAEKKAAEWRLTISEPDFGDWDKKEKPKITLPLRGAEKSS